jgi:hypothetical protein
MFRPLKYRGSDPIKRQGTAPRSTGLLSFGPAPSNRPILLLSSVSVTPPCKHLALIADVVASAAGCEDCLAIGSGWVHLRLCLVCGHVGCCDDSPHRHATRHFHATGHPVMRSFEPGEAWGWCFVDQLDYDPMPGPAPRRGARAR